MARNDQGGVEPFFIIGGTMMAVFVALVGYLIYGIFVPTCYIATVEARGGPDDAYFRFTRQAKTKVEAVGAAQQMMQSRPQGTEVTEVDIHGEGRAWFCK